MTKVCVRCLEKGKEIQKLKAELHQLRVALQPREKTMEERLEALDRFDETEISEKKQCLCGHEAYEHRGYSRHCLRTDCICIEYIEKGRKKQ